MSKITTRVIRRNNGNRVWRYEWHTFVDDKQIDYSFAMTKLGSRYASWKAVRTYFSRLKRSKDPVIAGEYERNVKVNMQNIRDK